MRKPYLCQIVTIFAFFLASFPSTGLSKSDGPCKSIFRKIKAVVKLRYRDSAVYQCDHCFYNSGELGRVLKESLGSEFDSSRTRIIVIKELTTFWKNGYLSTKANSRMKQNQENLRNKANPWMYHVVIRYGDRFIDLDYKQPWTAIPISQYFKKVFPSSDLSRLLITEIPLEEYLDKYSQRPWHENYDPNFQTLMTTHPTIGAKQYIEYHSGKMNLPDKIVKKYPFNIPPPALPKTLDPNP